MGRGAVSFIKSSRNRKQPCPMISKLTLASIDGTIQLVMATNDFYEGASENEAYIIYVYIY